MRTWLESIENGTTIYIAYALLLLLPAVLVKISATKKVNIAKFILGQLFAFYMCCVMALVFLPLPSLSEASQLAYQMQRIPFQFVKDIMRNRDFQTVAQVVFNIVMTIPFGMYVRYGLKLTNKQVFFASLALTCFIELGQLTGLFFIYQGFYRLCDVDDILMNTLGGMLGCFAVNKMRTFLPELDSFDKELVGTKLVKRLA